MEVVTHGLCQGHQQIGLLLGHYIPTTMKNCNTLTSLKFWGTMSITPEDVVEAPAHASGAIGHESLKYLRRRSTMSGTGLKT
jgi:hypothetical protein